MIIKLLTLKEYTDITKQSRVTVWRQINAGKLTAYKTKLEGKKLYFIPQEPQEVKQ